MALPISIARRRTDIGTGWDSRIDELSVDLAMIEQNTVKFTYDFAAQGGAISVIPLGTIPDNAIVTDVYYDVVSAVLSGGAAQIAIDINTDAAGIVAAAVLGTNGTVGLHCSSVGEILVVNGENALVTAARRQGSYIKTAAARTIDLPITVAPLTAGRLHVYVSFFISE